MLSEHVPDTVATRMLDDATRAPKITSGPEGHDLSTSMRTGEDPERIAREIDGIEYVRTEDVGIGRLGIFDLVEGEQ